MKYDFPKRYSKDKYLSTYTCWADMKHRCFNKNNRCYDSYGGRGITVCKTWVKSFARFLQDMGEKPNGKTLGRIDNDKGYSKNNCRWESWTEQNNNSRWSRFLTLNGETMTVAQWARKAGIHRDTLMGRVRNGWPTHLVLTKKKFAGFRSVTAALDAARSKT